MYLVKRYISRKCYFNIFVSPWKTFRRKRAEDPGLKGFPTSAENGKRKMHQVHPMHPVGAVRLSTAARRTPSFRHRHSRPWRSAGRSRHYTASPHNTARPSPNRHRAGPYPLPNSLKSYLYNNFPPANYTCIPRWNTPENLTSKLCYLQKVCVEFWIVFNVFWLCRDFKDVSYCF